MCACTSFAVATLPAGTDFTDYTVITSGSCESRGMLPIYDADQCRDNFGNEDCTGYTIVDEDGTSHDTISNGCGISGGFISDCENAPADSLPACHIDTTDQ